ncbi:hypothetical protein IE81DRAFT_26308 [Ceraceosorus guamensis]|uniref:Uncharacterized protein n=1 Tax=Ceraceosorus guamensis TaxID=1522189 RepID=A0A316VVH3_9BASI|nr:hypothetical protein IE81DRAFT_26308 [Ceraceosorus guamensis]PWN39445.1 hypothetical protein IE81DRAFT_26308 [Ceraceosorus guamensis]
MRPCTFGSSSLVRACPRDGSHLAAQHLALERFNMIFGDVSPPSTCLLIRPAVPLTVANQSRAPSGCGAFHGAHPPDQARRVRLQVSASGWKKGTACMFFRLPRDEAQPVLRGFTSSFHEPRRHGVVVDCKMHSSPRNCECLHAFADETCLLSEQPQWKRFIVAKFGQRRAGEGRLMRIIDRFRDREVTDGRKLAQRVMQRNAPPLCFRSLLATPLTSPELSW